MNIDFGLSVTFDGKSYTLMEADHIQEYPIGGLICEYCRLAPTEVKDVILKCQGLDEPVNVDTVTHAVLEFHQKLLETFPPVCAVMVSLEFQNAAQDWMKAIREDCVEKFTTDYFSRKENDQIQAFILEDTPYSVFGCSTILQMMLSCYYSFATTYVNTKYMFNHILGKDGESEQRDKVLKAYSDFYGDLMDIQHIDFRILATVEKGLESLYTIKSSLSLLLFEMAHATRIDQRFTVCPNCGNIFVPEGRSDIVYCTYPSPQNKEKSCREVGAQVARANKEKNDVVTGAYRKAYMRYKMMTKRHPNDKAKARKFESLTEGMKEWRIKLADGTGTTEDFLDWLSQF